MGDAEYWHDLLPAILARFPTAEQLSLETWAERRDPWRTWSSETRVAEALQLAAQRMAAHQLPPLARSLSTAQVLDVAARGGIHQAAMELARRRSESDRNLMLGALQSGDQRRAAAAVRALGDMGDVRILDFVVQTVDDTQPPVGYLIAYGIRALAQLPREAVLPLAREWLDSSWPGRHWAAMRILERHASQMDLPWARGLLRGPMNCDRGEISSALRIVETIGPAEPVPEVPRIFDLFPYSCARSHAARVLAMSDPTWPTGRALASLWDCEEEVRAVAARTVDLSTPGAEERLSEMAADPHEEKVARNTARERLGGSSA